MLRDGASVALYHTAGKGTRLAPLPGAENNNKPGVKLPSVLPLAEGEEGAGSSSHAVLTILEAVIKQTGVYAPSRRGRLSVFWGDQVFIPSAPATYKVRRGDRCAPAALPHAAAPCCQATHHADILCSLGPMMSAEEWEARGMEKYGLIAVNEAGDAAQVEKVTHATASRLLASFGTLAAVGVSLGSFSVSCDLLQELLGEFGAELSAKVRAAWVMARGAGDGARRG